MIKITVNGADHEITREEALRLHAAIAADLGLGLSTLPSWPVPVPALDLNPGIPGQPDIGGALWLVDPRSQPIYSDSMPAMPPGPTPAPGSGDLALIDSCLVLPTPSGPVHCTQEQTELLRRGLAAAQEDPDLDQSLMCSDLTFGYVSATRTITLAVQTSYISFALAVGTAMLRVITGDTTQKVNIGH